MKRRDPPFPPRGSPLPSRSLSPGGGGCCCCFFFSCLLLLLLTPPAPHTTILPGRWVREPPPPGSAPERGGFAGPRCPHPGRQSHGAEARGPAPPIPPPPPRFSPFICFISFFPLFFFFFLLFLPHSPFLSFPLASEGGGRQRDYFFFFPAEGSRGTAERRRCGNDSQ